MPVSHHTTNEYHNFDLLITRAGDTYRAYVIDAPGGDANATFTVPFALQEIGRLNRGSGTRRHLLPGEETVIASSSTLRELGSRLYDAVFRDKVRSVLIDSQTEAQAKGHALRIRLRFSDDAVELATLPWEILFDPEQQHFLALSEARPILRYLSLPRSRPPLKVEPPLAILVVLASPAGHTHLEVEQEWQAIETALAPLTADGKVTLERLAMPTLEALRNRLLYEPIHVLHFVGHGIYDTARGEGALLFEDAQRQGHLIPAKSLAILLHNHSSLRLVYLNACEGAIAAEGNVFAGVAQTLVQQGVPAAVAMQDEITDAAAIKTARTFYTALATGRPVDAALTQARVALAAHENNEWAIPVLFSRSPDNRLFDLVDVLPTPDRPYPGMKPFSEEQQNLFFGRDLEIEEAVNRLAQHPFLIVVGPSGSGKSSLVYAGIMPALKQSRRFGDGEWDIKLMRPSDSRTADGKAAPLQALTQLLDLSLQSPVANRQSPTLLFIDQFEEVFTLADAGEAEQFLQALHALIKTSNLHILLTVRADFYPEMMAMGALWEVVKANRLELTPLGDDELWSAIVQPAAAVGVTVDEALVVELIHDAAGEAGVLPLVQETLVLLWEKVVSRQLKLKAYQAMADGGRSGIQVAIDRRASVIYNNLPAPAQPIARRIFLRLIQFGAGRADTRRQQTVAELRASGDDSIRFEETLRTLVDSRLLTTSGKEGDPNRRVDISHEALIGGWALLQKWIGEKREAESTRRRLEDKVTEWLRLEKSGGLLDEYEVLEVEAWLTSDYSGELGYRQELVDLKEASRAAIADAEAEKAEAERTRRRAQIFAGGLVMAALAIALVGWFWWQATDSESKAVAAAGAAKQSEEVAVSARATAEIAATEEAVQRQVADNARKEAETSAEEARVAEATAIAAEAEAQIARRSAELAGFALTELEVHTDPSGDLALLLAREAVLSTWQQEGYVSAAAMFGLNRALQEAPPSSETLAGHADRVWAATFSPNGKHIVTASQDSTAKIWDANAGKLLFNLEHANGVIYAAFSPDGNHILTSTRIEDPTTKIWDVQTGIEVFTLRGHTVTFPSKGFSPDGAHIITRSADDNTAKVWDVQNGAEVYTLSGHAEGLTSAVYSPDGSSIVTASSDGTVRVWDAQSGNQILSLPEQPYGYLIAQFSPDGNRILTTSLTPDITARTWDAKTGAELYTLADSIVIYAVFSPDGNLIVTTHDDGAARVWDARNGTQLFTLGRSGYVLYAAFSPDGNRIITTFSDGTARAWDTQSGRQLLNLPHPSAVTAAAISPDGNQLVTASEDGVVKLWDDQNTGEFLIFLGWATAVNSAAFSSDGNRVITTNDGLSGKVWDAHSGAELFDSDTPFMTVAVRHGGLKSVENYGDEYTVVAGNTLHANIWDAQRALLTVSPDGLDLAEFMSFTQLFRYAAFSPDGSRIVSISDDGTTILWDAQSGVELVNFSKDAVHFVAAAFSPDGNRIVTASGDGSARVWDAWSGVRLHTFIGHEGSVTDAVYSPDGSRIATTSSDGTAKIWNAQSGSELLTLSGHAGAVNSAIFSADSKRIVTASSDNTAKVWNVQNGNELYTLSGHAGAVLSVAFSPDESRIITTSSDNTVKIWNDVEPLLDLVLAKVQRDPPELTAEERVRYGFNK